MTDLVVEPFEPSLATEWDAFVARADAGTFLHSRRYLAHQGDRFEEHGVMVRESARGRLVGVLPAAARRDDAQTVVSHPGLTYGGMLHCGRLGGARMEQALRAAAGRFADEGLERLVYRCVPHIYHRRPAEDDLHALHRMGARLVRRDLSSVVDLTAGIRPNEQRRRWLRRASEAGITVSRDVGHLAGFHDMLAVRLAERHGVRPVHTLIELQGLVERFGATGEVGFLVAELEGELVGGTVLFRTARAHHAQYIASTARGNETGALDAVFFTALEEATAAGVRYFSFGSNATDHQGGVNEGLHRWKSSFGAGGQALDHYELDLRALNSA